MFYGATALLSQARPYKFSNLELRSKIKEEKEDLIFSPCLNNFETASWIIFKQGWILLKQENYDNA